MYWREREQAAEEKKLPQLSNLNEDPALRDKLKPMLKKGDAFLYY